MNTVTLTGRLVADLDPDSYQSGDRAGTVARFDLAVDRGPAEGTDYIPVTVFDTLAATCADQIGRGHLVAVTGRLRQSSWETPEGDKRSRLEVVATQVDFLARPKANRDPEGGTEPL